MGAPSEGRGGHRSCRIPRHDRSIAPRDRDRSTHQGRPSSAPERSRTLRTRTVGTPRIRLVVDARHASARQHGRSFLDHLPHGVARWRFHASLTRSSWSLARPHRVRRPLGPGSQSHFRGVHDDGRREVDQTRRPRQRSRNHSANSLSSSIQPLDPSDVRRPAAGRLSRVLREQGAGKRTRFGAVGRWHECRRFRSGSVSLGFSVHRPTHRRGAASRFRSFAAASILRPPPARTDPEPA